MKPETRMLAEKASRLLVAKGLTVSVAESCTGGYLSHLLTLLPGASAFFIAGAVTYSAESKEKLLGVRHEVIDGCGTVCTDTVRSMALGIGRLTGSSLAVATTGNIGPTGIEEKDVGLVYIAVTRGSESAARELHLAGSRDENREAAAAGALSLLIEVAEKL